MSSVSSISSLFPDQSAAKDSSSITSASSTVVSKDEFLQLLVAQLKHQDPMNPVNNDQFLTQLATFSSLEQLISINEAVTSLAGGGNTDKAETAV
jgi:flagellar basal-body rod modification protein FlgD